MDVSGQPRWLEPDTYASSRYIQIPKQYKKSYNENNDIEVTVIDQEGKLVEENHILKRNPKKTAETLETGNIRTYSNYESHWYSFDLMDKWIETHWNDTSYHFKTKNIDIIRAEPAQLAIFDPGKHLHDLFKKWELV
jgi:hypothetical protein